MRTMYILRTDDRPTDRPRILENFERPYYLGNWSSDSCLVLGSVFEVGGSNGPTSGWTKSKKISNDHISGMSYPIHFHELQSSFGGIQEKIMREE